jgi:hypothetical protein
MGKFTDLQTSLFNIFDSQTWKNTGIKTIPSNFTSKTLGSEFIRVNIIPRSTGINTKSISGIMIIDIFTAAGLGPNRSSLIADLLDDFLVGKNIGIRDGVNTQLGLSSLTIVGSDSSNSALFRAQYTITFNFFGVD